MPDHFTPIPRTRAVDSAPAFLQDGYVFGQRRFAELGADAFHMRLLGQPATFVRGAEWARLFYEGDRFTRDRAMPTSVKHLLQDDGSVQSLDGEDHLARKQLFVRLLMDDDELARLRALLRTAWLEAVQTWPARTSLAEQINPILTRTALNWMGIDPAWLNLDRLSHSLTAMVQNAGRFGPSNWLARRGRQTCEQVLGRLLGQVRAGRLPLDSASPLAQFAEHRDADDRPLDNAVLTVEVLNVLRPIVAVGWFIVGATLLLEAPGGAPSHDAAQALRANPGDRELEEFVQEVRRLHPFFPVIGGRAMRGFTWEGNRFHPGDWVILDLFSTNRDERSWADPLSFRPSRFRDWDGDPNTLVPQGAGDVRTGHRCPGERATIELMKESLRILVEDLSYDVPKQNTTMSLRNFPARPKDGVVMLNTTALRKP